MLYLNHQGNHPGLDYRGGEEPVIHLEADLHTVVNWAQQQGRRWAFTLSNAGSYFFEDRSDLAQLTEVNWSAVQARDWRKCKEGKQAEVLVEQSYPWLLIGHIGVQSRCVYQQVVNALPTNGYRPAVSIRPDGTIEQGRH